MFGTLEPDIYFYGETIEKIGDGRVPHHQGRLHHLRAAHAALGDRHRQATINLEDYAILRNAVVRVKDVPVFYLPDPLLPDSERRPRHGVSAADLRPLDSIAASRSATRSSGRSTAART